MGDVFKREFSVGQVDTGTPYDPGKVLQPGNSIHFGVNNNPAPDIHPSGMSLPGVPTATQTVARPTFLSAFLQNLGPSLAGSLQAPKGSGIGGGIAGGFAGISKEQHDKLQERFIQQQLDTTKQSTDARTALEKAQTEQMGSMITLPNGSQVPFALAQKIFPTMLGIQSKEGIAEANRDARTDEGAANRASRESIAADALAGRTANAKPNELQLIQKANSGDTDAASTLKTLQDRRMQIAKARGGGQFSNFFDPEQGRNIRMSNEDAQAQQTAGKTLIPAGPVGATQIIQTQRAQSAIPSAIAEVRKNLGAWDNKQDQAIFSKVISETSTAGVDHATWLGNVINKALKDNLSPEGRRGIIALGRLNESLGSLRAITGLPSTVGSMATTAALAPGPQTPNSKFAGEQLDTIQKLVEQETGVPFLGLNKSKSSTKSSGGGRVIDLR